MQLLKYKVYPLIRTPAYEENDANCNTCLHLVRIKHAKDKAGFLYGNCLNDKHESLPFESGIDGVIQFHPEDSMLMTCYEIRPSITEKYIKKIYSL